MAPFLSRYGSLFCVLASAAFAGCSQVWTLPVKSDGTYNQSIDIVGAAHSSSGSSHFPHRKDLAKRKPDSPARIRIRRMPNVPLNMGPLDAELELWAVVEIDGTAREVVVGKSTGNPGVDDLYVNAVRNWSFAAAQVGGMPVAQQIRQVFTIKLE
jgi:TonB family protein